MKQTLSLFAIIMLTFPFYSCSSDKPGRYIVQRLDTSRNIRPGDSLLVRLMLQNTDVGTLHIDRVWANCSCTKVGASKNVIEEGDSTLIEATYHSSSSSLGPQDVRVFLKIHEETNIDTLRIKVSTH